MALPRPLAERIIEFAGKLDLGRKPMDYGCSPIGPAMPPPQVWYPNLWIEGVDQPIDLPDKGKAIIDYKVTRKTTTDTDGKKRHEASLEVHSIEPVEKEKKSEVGSRKSESGTAKTVKFSALRPGMVGLRDSAFRTPHSEFHFDRSRNTDGEFAPQAEGAPDPATMRAAYGPKPGLAKAGKVAGAAVGLGGTAAAALLLARRMRK